MNDNDLAFFDDDYDASTDKGKFMPMQSPNATGSGGSKFDIHCDLHGSSSSQNNEQHRSEMLSEKQRRKKSYSSDSSSSSGKESENELFSPRSNSGRSLSDKSINGKKSYNKEDYDRDVSKRSNSPLVLTSSDSEDDDDTLTDVSPRSSPAGSPSMKRCFRFSDDDIEEQRSGSGERAKQMRNDDNKHWSAQAQRDQSSDEEEVKHITKLNVTFKPSERESRKHHHHSERQQREPASRKHKTKSRKLHRGEGDSLSIDHIEGSLSRYFEKSKEDRPKSSSSQRKRSNRHQGSIDESIDDVASAQQQHHGMEDSFAGCDDKDADDSVDLNHLFEMILDLEERGVNVKEKFEEHSTKRQTSRRNQQQQQRKNMSFSNDQARQIDRENSRLYKEITKRASSATNTTTQRNRPSSSTSVRSRQSVRSNASSARSSASTMGGGRRSRMSSAASSSASSSYYHRQHPAAPKLYHSAVNRINSQRQIERENMQLLKRLQEAKPTPSLQRTNQLRDYSRQTRYMGSPATATTPTSRRTRRYAAELARDPEVVQQALDIGEQRFRQIRPAWQDVW